MAAVELGEEALVGHNVLLGQGGIECGHLFVDNESSESLAERRVAHQTRQVGVVEANGRAKVDLVYAKRVLAHALVRRARQILVDEERERAIVVVDGLDEALRDPDQVGRLRRQQNHVVLLQVEIAAVGQ